jgi:nucleoside-diphosphate-sugar epimerase
MTAIALKLATVGYGVRISGSPFSLT